MTMIDFRKKPAGFNAGIYRMSFDRYAKIEALNHSKLKQLERSPLHFKTIIESPKKEISPQLQRIFDRGKAFDIYILEGGLPTLMRQVALEPQVNKNSKNYKDWKVKIPEDKLILSPIEYRNIAKMADSARTKNQFNLLFNEGFPHRVLIWQEQRNGLWCKAELDWITKNGIIVDLKTTSDASFFSFYKSVRRYKYLNQAAFYLDGLTHITGFRHKDFYFAAVETEAPFESVVYRPSQSQITNAQIENENYIESIATCLKTGTWPGYVDEVIDLDSGQYIEQIQKEGENDYDIGI